MKNDLLINNIKTKITAHQKNVDDTSFYGGLPGLALFYYYYYLYTNNSNNKIFLNLIESNIHNISKINTNNLKYKTDSIDYHLASFGRFLIFIKYKLKVNIEIENILNQLDSLLVPLLHHKLKNKDFDLNSGALASGNYLAYRIMQNDNLYEEKKIRKYS